MPPVLFAWKPPEVRSLPLSSPAWLNVAAVRPSRRGFNRRSAREAHAPRAGRYEARGGGDVSPCALACYNTTRRGHEFRASRPTTRATPPPKATVVNREEEATMETPTRSRLDALRQVTAAVDRWRGADRATTSDELVAEEPLEVRALARVGADGSAPAETLAVIMRTPGHDEE